MTEQEIRDGAPSGAEFYAKSFTGVRYCRAGKHYIEIFVHGLWMISALKLRDLKPL